MKKLFTSIALILILVISSNVRSQSIALGVEGGINIANVSITPTGTTNSRTGIIVGAVVDINISPNIAVTSGLRYNMKGWSSTGQGVTFTDKLGYLEFPALLKVKFPLTEIKPYVIGGLTLGIKMSATEEQSNGTQTADQDISSSVESTDFGLLFGAGMDFKVGAKTMLFIQPAYSLGLSNISKITTATVKTNGFQITAGVKFAM